MAVQPGTSPLIWMYMLGTGCHCYCHITNRLKLLLPFTRSSPHIWIYTTHLQTRGGIPGPQPAGDRRPSPQYCTVLAPTADACQPARQHARTPPSPLHHQPHSTPPAAARHLPRTHPAPFLIQATLHVEPYTPLLVPGPRAQPPLHVPGPRAQPPYSSRSSST